MTHFNSGISVFHQKFLVNVTLRHSCSVTSELSYLNLYLNKYQKLKGQNGSALAKSLYF